MMLASRLYTADVKLLLMLASSLLSKLYADIKGKYFLYFCKQFALLNLILQH